MGSVSYTYQNYPLLQEVNTLLKSFPFSSESKTEIESVDWQSIKKDYRPHSDIEKDEVANAICWSADTIQVLFEERPFKALDEVISFNEKVLKNQK